jgi:hypothetical protein
MRFCGHAKRAPKLSRYTLMQIAKLGKLEILLTDSGSKITIENVSRSTRQGTLSFQHGKEYFEKEIILEPVAVYDFETRLGHMSRKSKGKANLKLPSPREQATFTEICIRFSFSDDYSVSVVENPTDKPDISMGIDVKLSKSGFEKLLTSLADYIKT